LTLHLNLADFSQDQYRSIKVNEICTPVHEALVPSRRIGVKIDPQKKDNTVLVMV
jgi:hypothetical protein